MWGGAFIIMQVPCQNVGQKTISGNLPHLGRGLLRHYEAHVARSSSSMPSAGCFDHFCCECVVGGHLVKRS